MGQALIGVDSPSRGACAYLERVESPPDRSDTNAIFLGQLWDSRSLAVPIGNHPLLASVEALRTSKPFAKPLGSFDALLSAGTDQVALELRDAAEDRQHQLACR